MKSLHFSIILSLAWGVTRSLAACPYADAQMSRSNIDVRNSPLHSHHGRDAHGSPIKKGMMMMNRIAPGTSELYIADVDGDNERPLLSNPVYEYHATFSPDGEWILFTSERNGDGNSDIYRIRTNGSDMQELVATPAVEDSVVSSPNGSMIAYVSTTQGSSFTTSYRANIWVMDLESGAQWNLTDTVSTAANASLMNGYFRPAWSPDGEWIAFSSDRNTGWDGHGDDTFLGLSGWEHTQELSVYAIRPNGLDFRKIAAKAGFSLGSPKWSSDGTRIIYYEMTREATWDAHRPGSVANVNSTLVSIDFATGTDRKVEVEGAGVKVFPQYLPDDEIAYSLKAGDAEGLHTTSGIYINSTVRSPAWSPDGKRVVYEKTTWGIRPMEKVLYSWDPEWEYRFTDVFPQLSPLDNRIAFTQKQLGNSSIITMAANGMNVTNIFDSERTNMLSDEMVRKGIAGAFNPNWSPDADWIVFGVGSWFTKRATNGGWIVKSTSNGSYSEILTNSTYDITDNSAINSGFPSFSHDGQKVVFRVWGAESAKNDTSQLGLRLLDLETKEITVLTNNWDTLPQFSPDGQKILFTRRTSPTNYDVMTMRPDGTDVQCLTTSGANDAHAVWRADGKILYSTGMFGFQYECALYDNTFQPYGNIMMMDGDGSNKRLLTNSLWEDSMPVFLPNDVL